MKTVQRRCLDFGGHTYDAMMILAQAIEKAGLDAAKVRTAIENLSGYFGTAGELIFQPKTTMVLV